MLVLGGLIMEELLEHRGLEAAQRFQGVWNEKKQRMVKSAFL